MANPPINSGTDKIADHQVFRQSISKTRQTGEEKHFPSYAEGPEANNGRNLDFLWMSSQIESSSNRKFYCFSTGTVIFYRLFMIYANIFS